LFAMMVSWCGTTTAPSGENYVEINITLRRQIYCHYIDSRTLIEPTVHSFKLCIGVAM